MTTELAKAKTPEKLSLVVSMAAAHDMEPGAYLSAIKSMCGCKGADNAHFMGLLMVAKEHGLNPILRQIYTMPTKKGVQIVIPVDGWLHLMHANPDYIAHDEADGEHETRGKWAEIRIHTHKRTAAGLGPFVWREWYSECYLDTGPWNSHPARMLAHKAASQGIRRCFGIYVMDEDEARGIGSRDGVPAEPDVKTVPVDVTPVIEMSGIASADEAAVNPTASEEADRSSTQEHVASADEEPGAAPTGPLAPGVAESGESLPPPAAPDPGEAAQELGAPLDLDFDPDAPAY